MSLRRALFTFVESILIKILKADVGDPLKGACVIANKGSEAKCPLLGNMIKSSGRKSLYQIAFVFIKTTLTINCVYTLTTKHNSFNTT